MEGSDKKVLKIWFRVYEKNLKIIKFNIKFIYIKHIS